jgi:hypothetical protein
MLISREEEARKRVEIYPSRSDASRGTHPRMAHIRHRPLSVRTRVPVCSICNTTSRSVDIATPQEAAASILEPPPRKPLEKTTLT